MLDKVEELLDEGNVFFNSGWHQHAMQRYKHAWGICIKHQLYQIASQICCCNLSIEALKYGRYDVAQFYADYCDEHFDKVRLYIKERALADLLECYNVDPMFSIRLYDPIHFIIVFNWDSVQQNRPSGVIISATLHYKNCMLNLLNQITFLSNCLYLFPHHFSLSKSDLVL